jgi:hypothetical protein
VNAPSPNDRDTLERRLDELVRPSLVLEPPPAVRADLLASVLRAADALQVAPSVATTAVGTAPTLGPGLSPLTYAAVAAVIAAYLALVGVLGSVVAEWEWLPILVRELATAVGILTGPSGAGLLETVLPGLVEQAPWLVLLPLLPLLWERDRAALGRRRVS